MKRFDVEVQSGFTEAARELPKKLYSNKSLLRSLTDTIAAGRLCHAYLFYGAKGIGKRTFACHFAAAILCRDGDKPCGECVSCKKVFSQSHPDLFLYEGKRGANALHIETIRQIRQDAFILPNESEYKIYILPHAEDMSPGAANAFLKVLEEPPSHVVFLLTADNPEFVPETIRSRCILQELYPMPDRELSEALKELCPDHTEEERREAADIANGNLGRAVEVLESPDYAEVSALSGRLAQGLASGSEYEILAAISAASQSKDKLYPLLERFSHSLRETLLAKFSCGADTDNPLAGRLSATQLEAAFEALEQARSAAERNANLGLLANYLTVNLMKAIGLG